MGKRQGGCWLSQLTAAGLFVYSFGVFANESEEGTQRPNPVFVPPLCLQVEGRVDVVSGRLDGALSKLEVLQGRLSRVDMVEAAAAKVRGT